MSEPQQPEQITIRSVTVSEVMDAEGTVGLEISTEGEPETWHVAGLLAAGLESTRIDLQAVWTDEN